VSTINELAGEIGATDQMLGWLCRQAVSSYEREDYFASFLTLSVLAEQAVREKADSVDGDYSDAVRVLLSNGMINEGETVPLLKLKHMQSQVSNTYMHVPDMSATFAADGEDVMYPYNEETTWGEFMKTHMLTIFRIVAKVRK
jgi:hypothetical protein